MKQKTTNFLFSIGIYLLLSAQTSLIAQNYAWAKSIGGNDSELSNAITVDGSGNIYITGFFTGTVDFDPNASTVNLTATGNRDIFVVKLDASGNLLWAKNMGGAGRDESTTIAVDGSGNVYTTGFFEGTADFDPNAGTANLTSAGAGDIFISKLDASGNFVWVKSIGDVGSDSGGTIAVDGSGNVYLMGSFTGTVDFDPNAGTVNLTPIGTDDIFICKFTASGNLTWAKNIGGTGSDFALDLAVDGSGNVYTTGGFQNTVDFDPNAGTANLTSSGSWDVFVSKLDASGNYVWAKKMGGASYDDGRSIAVDGSGNVYITGYFQATADFDPNAGSANLTSAGGFDIFVSKLDASGNYLWAKGMGSTANDYTYRLALDGSGNVYTVGNFSGTVDFDPGAGTASLSSAGGFDIFVSKLDASGNYVWAKSMGSTANDSGLAVAVYGSGTVYTTGYFNGTVDFDPNNCITNLSAVVFSDIFVSKLSETPRANFYNWLGGSTDWSATTNWSCGVAPTNVDAVTILPTANIPTLTTDQTIGDLTFSGSSKIQLGNFNLTVNSLTGGNSSAYVVTNGTGSLKIKNVGTTAKLFPIGPSTSVYAPATITNNVNRDFSVKVGTAITNPISGYKYVNLQWDITPSVLTGNSATLALGWSSGSQASGFSPASAVQINHYNTTTSSWDISTSATVSGSNPYTATASGISSFSPFTVSNVAVLPVELLDFRGSSSVSGNLLTWTTANEQNNKGFEVERSPQPPKGAFPTWESIGFVNGKGKAASYNFTDKAPFGGWGLYRLRQIDNDGTETLSKVISIERKGNKGSLKAYPNPAHNSLTIDYPIDVQKELEQYTVVNTLGQTLLQGKLSSNSLDISSLPTGAFIIKIGEAQCKFLKQ